MCRSVATGMRTAVAIGGIGIQVSISVSDRGASSSGQGEGAAQSPPPSKGRTAAGFRAPSAAAIERGFMREWLPVFGAISMNEADVLF
jgi:hypothetical protein